MKLSHLFVLSAAAVVPAGALGADPQVDMRTNLGTIRLELYPAAAPKTVENFLQYANSGFYKGTIFHRVIDGFMIQGGGFEPGMKQKRAKAPIKNESGNGLKNSRGALAMARTSDLDSATAQFYINVLDNPNLDQGKYAVFGKVIEGMDVVDKIKAVKTGSRGGHGDVPAQDVVITSMKRA